MAKDTYVPPKVIESLKDFALEGEAVTLDLTEDAWSYGAPPPWGAYDVKWMLDKGGISVGYGKEGVDATVYYQFKFIGSIVNTPEEEWDGIPVYYNLNTKIPRGKEICSLAAFINKAGYGKNIPSPVTPKRLGLIAEAVIKKEPVVKTECDWRGSYTWTDKNGNTQYENVFNHYTEFPENKEKPGTKMHIVTVTKQASHGGGTAEVRAMLNVTRMFGKGDTIPKYDVKKGGGSQPVFAPKPVVEVPELVMDSGPKLVNASAVGPQIAQQVGEDDLSLILES